MNTSDGVDLAIGAANIIADGLPVPFLSTALGTLRQVIRTCQNAEANKAELQALGERCKLMLDTLESQVKIQTTNTTASSPGPTQALDPLSSTLKRYHESWKELLKNVEEWSQYTKVQAMTNRKKVTQGIQNAEKDINLAFQAFVLVSHVKIHDRHANEVPFDHEAMQYRLDGMEDDLRTIRNLLCNEESKPELQEVVKSLPQELLANVILYMSNYLQQEDPESLDSQTLRDNIYDVQHRTGQLLPELHSHAVSRDFPTVTANETPSLPNRSLPVISTVTCDIYKGTYLNQPCALKVFRGVNFNADAKRRFRQESWIWREIFAADRSTYILPFWGSWDSDDGRSYIVSPWMDNGDARAYLESNPNANRKAIITRTAQALEFLHTRTPPIIHGRVRAHNVMINDKREAMLADFGLSKVLEDIDSATYTQSIGVSSAYRWFAPELLSDSKMSPRSDVFSFAMTMLEIFTGKDPFAEEKKSGSVILAMATGRRPRRPLDTEITRYGLNDDIWQLMQDCWCQTPEDRLTMTQVVERLIPAPT